MASEDYNHLPAVMAAIERAIKDAIVEAARQVEEQAKSNAPVQTGYLRDSIYAVTTEGSDYHSGAKSLPEVGKPGDGEAVVAVAASYALFVELGTSRAGAQPFLTPAAETVRGNLASIVADNINAAIGKG